MTRAYYPSMWICLPAVDTLVVAVMQAVPIDR
jgi:hypothetical protein